MGHAVFWPCSPGSTSNLTGRHAFRHREARGEREEEDFLKSSAPASTGIVTARHGIVTRKHAIVTSKRELRDETGSKFFEKRSQTASWSSDARAIFTWTHEILTWKHEIVTSKHAVVTLRHARCRDARARCRRA